VKVGTISTKARIKLAKRNLEIMLIV